VRVRLPHIPSAVLHPLRPALGLLRRSWRMVGLAYRRLFLHSGPLMAAAIAFYSVVCLGPLAILVGAALQIAYGPGTDAYRQIESAVADLGGEAAQQIMPQVDSLLANPMPHAAGVVSLLALIWAGHRLFETVEHSLASIWPGRVLRTFWMRKLVALGMMGAAGLLLAGLMLLGTATVSLRVWLEAHPELPPQILEAVVQHRPRVSFLYVFGLSVMAYLMLYKFIPVRPVPSLAALTGALGAALLWQAASPAFTYLIRRSQEHSVIYGGLAGVVAFELWVLLGAQIMLFGAHLAAACEHVFIRGRPVEEDDLFLGTRQRDLERDWLGRE